jgi:hypothetical protein
MNVRSGDHDGAVGSEQLRIVALVAQRGQCDLWGQPRRGLMEVRDLATEVLIESVVERELDPPEHVATGCEEHHEHRYGEACDESESQG